MESFLTLGEIERFLAKIEMNGSFWRLFFSESGVFSIEVYYAVLHVDLWSRL